MSNLPKNTCYNSTDSFEVKNQKALEYIEDVTSNADDIQREVLENILSSNANAEYLQRHGLNGRTDRETFKNVMPIITYEDIQSDINRIANGDDSPILCSKPISGFLTSTGTSGGEPKLIPAIEEEIEKRVLMYSLLLPGLSKCVTGLEKGKAMYFLFTRPEVKTPGGLAARSTFTSFFKSSYFKDRPYDLYYTSPYEVILFPDTHQSMYVQLLCGLCQRQEVVRVGALFASGFLNTIKFLESHWVLLCNDIRTGSVDAHIKDETVRNAVMQILEPNPELADFVEAECSKKSWQGIVTKLWPNSKFVDVIATGSMLQYIKLLDYYTNNLPIFSSHYGSSECYFGINLEAFTKPSEVFYTIIPVMAYYEFLPVVKNDGVSDGNQEQKPVDLVDVKLGEEYEILITTYAGLYRYKVGDVLRVAGFKNKAPQFNFVCRRSVALSVDSDKTNEEELQNAVDKAVSLLSPFEATLVDYTSYADTKKLPGHYVLFWEIMFSKITPVPSSIFQDCCLTMEESLSSGYRRMRACDKTVGPLEIRLVESGSFDKLMNYLISSGGSFAQYKTPRCVKLEPVIELLNSTVSSNYFSPKCPNWSPGLKEWL